MNDSIVVRQARKSDVMSISQIYHNLGKLHSMTSFHQMS
jgi:hypothetical protein